MRGSPAARRDDGQPPRDDFDGRRPSMGAGPGSAEVGPAPVWRAAPRARAETLRAAPETVSGTGQQHGGAAGGEWGVGSGEWGREAGGGGSSGGQGPTPWGSRRPTIDPSQRKIAPRRAAQPLKHQGRGGVGAGPHASERRRRKLAKNGKNDLEFFRFFGVFGRVFGRAPAPKTPSAARTAWKRLLYRRS